MQDLKNNYTGRGKAQKEELRMKKGKVRSKKKTIIISLVGAAAAVGGLTYYNSTVSSADKATEKETVSVEKRDLQKSVTLSGTVQSADVSNLRSTVVETKVIDVKVKVGDKVKKGDVIAVLDDTDLRKQLEDAETALENSKVQSDLDLQSAQRLYDNALEGQDTMSNRGQKYVNEAQNDLNKAIGKQNNANNSYNNAVNNRSNLEQAANQADNDAYNAAVNAGAKEGELAIAQANLNDAQAAYDQLCAQLSSLPEAPEAPVATGDASIDEAAAKIAAEQTEQLNQQRSEIQGKIDEAKNRLDQASADLENAKQAVVDAKADAEAKATYASQLKESILTAKQSEAEAKMAKETADANVSTMQSALEKAADDRTDTNNKYANDVLDSQDKLTSTQLTAGQSVDANQQKIDKLKEQIEACTVRAQNDGVVTAVNVEVGDIYHGDDIATVQDDTDFLISTNADQYDVFSIATGMDSNITIQALSKNIEGEVSFIAPTPTPSLDPAVESTNYKVEIALKEKDDRLRIGMTAKTVIVMDEKKDALCVPDNAIHKNADGSTFVMVTSDGQNEEQVEVECGFESDYYTEITGTGISEGVQIVLPDGSEGEPPAFY